MSDLAVFTVAIIAVMFAVLAFAASTLGGLSEAAAYFRTRQGRRVLTSMLMAVGAAVGMAFILYTATAQARWLHWAEVYAGVDIPVKQSPQCRQFDPIDNRLTSNFGARVAIWERRRFTLAGAYTHHSCALGVDRRVYDALGVQATYRVTW